MFPFESRFFTTPRGHVMHYVDEGAGEPIVFVHGNPAWSFELRHLIGGWPVSRDPHFWFFSRMMASPLGQYLIKRRNFFVNGVMPKAVGNKDALSVEVMEHYRRAQPSPAERAANAALPGFIVGATEWLGEIWEERSAFVGKPALVLWGAKDIAFRTKELDRWRSELSEVAVHEFTDYGHFLAEEAPERVLPLLRAFVR